MTNQEPSKVAVTDNATVSTETNVGAALALIDKAIAAGHGIEQIDKLVALHERIADRFAAQEFADAFASFQETCPQVRKNRSTKGAGRGGAGYGFRYASLDEIDRTVRPVLAKHRLSYTFDSEMTEDGKVRAVCTLRHPNGHSVSASFTAPIDKGGSMNEVQKHGSALTYAKRYALEQVLGISTTDDTDGNPPGPPPAVVSEQQVATLREWIESTDSDEAAFLQWCGAQSIETIPASKYEAAVAKFKKKASR